jgi:hypothetical protein
MNTKFSLFFIQKRGELRKTRKKDAENVGRRLIRVLDSYIYVCVFICGRIRKARAKGEKNVTLNLMMSKKPVRGAPNMLIFMPLLFLIFVPFLFWRGQTRIWTGLSPPRLSPGFGCRREAASLRQEKNGRKNRDEASNGGGQGEAAGEYSKGAGCLFVFSFVFSWRVRFASSPTCFARWNVLLTCQM